MITLIVAKPTLFFLTLRNVADRSTSTAGIVLVDVDLLAIGEYYF